MTILARYFPALLPALVVLFGSLQLALADDRIDQVEGGQLIALVAGLVVTYFVPLVKGKWAGALKTGAGVLAAVATLIIPLFLVGGLSIGSLIGFALAVLTALATELGVQLRKDTTAARHVALEAPVVTLSADSIASLSSYSRPLTTPETPRQPYPTE